MIISREKEQFDLDCMKYVTQAGIRETKSLNKQRKRNLGKIKKVEKKIKALKFKDSEYNFKLELIERMKEYVEKYSFLPQSYKNMLSKWG